MKQDNGLVIREMAVSINLVLHNLLFIYSDDNKTEWKGLEEKCSAVGKEPSSVNTL